MKESIYLMHIPKTGGQYLSETLISALNEECKNNNLDTSNLLKDGHSGWLSRKDSDYTISIIRNPINRSVSHYVYYNPDRLNGSVKDVIKSILSFMENNSFMQNYQSKFLCSDQINSESNLNNQFFEYDLSKLEERTSQIDKLITTESLSPNLVKELYINSCNILNINPQNEIVFPEYRTYRYLSPLTKEIRDSFTKSDIQILKNLNNIDYNLYESVKNEY
jgi:hypothetical protein